jgi:CheY-like chemotaxis protein/anti-sigma regulatory factor (Ser/Thr protein kinase)
VIINLLSNAGRFTERGGVVIKAELERSKVAISVTDTGPGITEEDQKRLFRPFQQVDNSIRRQYEGTGLGLAISKRFVELHGGRIELHSEVGVGTTITFTLPREAPASFNLTSDQEAARWFHPYDEHTYNPRTRGTKAPAPKPMPRFVLVEPGRTLARLFKRYAPDIETLSAPSVNAAIEALNQSPAQALIVNTPPLPETEAMMQNLQDLPYGTPAMRCWVPAGDEEYKQLGVREYVVKPVTREKLLAILDRFAEDTETILLVDDDAEVLRLFSRIIASSSRHYRILQAPNGQRALDLMRERHPDLILVDLIMPGMSGHQVLIEKYNDPQIRSIPVAILSSRDPEGHLNTDTTLTVACSGGMTTRNLIRSMHEVSRIVAPMKENDR